MKIKFALSVVALLWTKVAVAEPFVNTSNLALRASLQNLADAGQLPIPLTTYPLMWSDINRVFKDIDLVTLDNDVKNDYFHVRYHLQKALEQQTTVELNAATDDHRFTSFGDNFRNKNNVIVATSDVYANFAYKFQPSYTTDPIEGDKVQFNDSYVAGKWGNWIATVGTQDRWWGPGWDSNVSLTNNARPMPAISISRNESIPFHVPFTDDYQIPWNVTTFMGQMEEERYVPNTLLWGFRMNFMLTDNLEFAVVRLAQWGGEGRPRDFKTFVNVLLGKDNCGATGSSGFDCDDDRSNEPGNQQAGYDVRYAVKMFDQPFTLYGQYYGEDGNAKKGLNFITKPAVLAGIDTHFKLANYTVNAYLEYTDTYKDCNCFYEHHIYKTGMRYKGRIISNLYDSDASTLVTGLIGQNSKGQQWDVRLRYARLNRDDIDRFPGSSDGNSVTDIAEDLVMLSGNFQDNWQRFTYKVGGSVSHSSFLEKASELDAMLHASVIWHY
ncbi:capsule assembly Wzi family protein [Thalassotalea sp. LPB0316]|uniref:capsule assembly Wzi family protein n=1 Tax=Thalassotalea sp. LPB0316 TaxID=2769490 RepID=UPI0018674443|nr:capsule assembly Wzi family protein [Thalassotalea sp. LPB0316]QOL26919.1 capsule assembly Wzi family protein [Thalassotalea sp. LPB0316]